MMRRLTLAALCAITVVSLSAQGAIAGRLAAVARTEPRRLVERNRARGRNGPPRGRRSRGEITGLGAGYGTVAVSGARIFVQGLRGRRTR